jgi:subtilisin family serine protease
MQKSRITFLVSIIFIFLFSSSFDLPRLREHEPEDQRMYGYGVYSINHGQPYRMGDRHYSPDRVLVKFKPSLSVQSIKTTIDAYETEKIEHIPNLGIYALEIPANTTVEEMVYTLRLNPDVAHVSPNYKIHITAVPKPTDSYFNMQYALYNEGQEIGFRGPKGKSRADIKALEAWEETKGDDQVVIAVLDTGIDFEHPDLANTDTEEKIASNGYDFVNKDNDPSDDHGHGTFVSGLIAAKSNNSEGIAGVSWHAKILPLKIIDSDDYGEFYDLLDAIAYAVEKGKGDLGNNELNPVDVISMSFGFTEGLDAEGIALLEQALEYAHTNGVVCVAAAGNEGSSVLYPAASDEYCIAVAATDYNDSRPWWSNFGPEVDVAAPGLDIIGPVPTWYPGLIWNDFTIPPYGFGDGTSASTAIVAGFVSLIISAKPWLEPDDIMDIVRFSADDVNADEHPGRDDYLGNGRADMEIAVVPIKIIQSK